MKFVLFDLINLKYTTKTVACKPLHAGFLPKHGHYSSGNLGIQGPNFSALVLHSRPALIKGGSFTISTLYALNESKLLCNECTIK